MTNRDTAYIPARLLQLTAPKVSTHSILLPTSYDKIIFYNRAFPQSINVSVLKGPFFRIFRRKESLGVAGL